VKATIGVGNRWTLTTMDGLGRTIKVEQGDSGGTTKSIVDTEYDSCACSPLGKVKRVSQPYAPGGTIYWTTYTYDGLGRTTSVSLPGGTGTTSYVYQGNTTTVTDPAGKWKKFTTDAMGNLTKVTEPNPAGGTDLDSNYTYDMFNHLKQVSMTRGSTTQNRTFVYDTNTQLLLSVTHPESGQTSYTYNSDGTVATKIDAKNQKIVYTYDSYKRVTQVQRYPVSTGTENLCQRIYFYYDTDPFDPTNLYQFLQNGWGRLTALEWYVPPGTTCTATDQSNGRRFIERYSYTSGGLVTKKRLYAQTGYTWPGAAGSFNAGDPNYMEAVYTYDNEGKMTSVKYPGDNNGSGPGRKYTYTFDTMGRANKLTDDQATPVDWAKNGLYGPAGEMTSLDYFKATGQYYTEARTYNSRLQLTQLRAYYTTTDSLNMQYVYSATQNNGQISQSIDTVSGETIDYTYDSLNRLITAATTGPQWGLSFTYDGFGNRTNQTVTKGSGPSNTVAISGTTNRITTAGYGYDSNGNMTTMPYGSGSMTLTYDIENRLTQAVNTNGTELYSYDSGNRRVYQKLASGTEQVFFYGVNGDRLKTYQLLANNQFSVTHTNIYFAGRLLRQDSTTTFIDRLGSVRNTSRFYPYGEEQGSGTIPDKFATYYRDSNTGLDYAQNRYYSSSLGRFTTPDPYASARLTNSGSWNRYGYVTDDPINKRDPTGLDEDEEDDEPRPGRFRWEDVPTFTTHMFQDEGPRDKCSDIADLDDTTTDRGLLTRLIFSEGTNAKAFGGYTEPYYNERYAIAAAVYNRTEYSRGSGPYRGFVGRDVGNPTLSDVIGSRGLPKAQQQFAGYSYNDKTANVDISQPIQNRINRALNSRPDSADCLNLLAAIHVATYFKPEYDPFGKGNTFAFRTRGRGGPGGSFVGLPDIPGSGNVFFGLE